MDWKRKLIALMAVLVLFASACGSSDDSSSSDDAAAVETDAGDDAAMEEDDTPEDTAVPEDDDPGPEPTEPPVEEAPAGGAGSGDNLLLLQWQAPSLANSMLSGGSKDVLAASLVIEPLARTGPDGSLVAFLAKEIPTLDNGGISDDLTQITWELQDGLLWSDGTAVTSEDVVFSWEYCTNETTGCTSLANFEGVTAVTANDDVSVTVTFDSPTPFPYLAFVGGQSPIIQKAQFAECIGEAAIECNDQNFAPIGTGPYTITELRPEDTVLYEWNPNYRKVDQGMPYFSTVEIKGGGDAESTARAVLESGEADRAWNLQVAPEILAPMEAAGNGEILVGYTSQVEHIHLNQTNPDSPDGSDYLEGANPHPLLFDDPELARALSIAINRDELVAVGYGANGEPTCNMWNVPGVASANNDFCLTQDIDGANAILDDLGYLDSDGDGVREKNGEPLSFDYVTSVNAVRQSNQELIKSYWADIGVEVEMKAEDASLFFDGTAETSIWRFPSDMEMFTNLPDNPDAFGYLTSWASSQIPESANGWSGSNFSRINNPELDQLLEDLSALPPTDGAYKDLVIRVNDIISAESGSTIPLIHRGSVVALSNQIKGHGELNAWDSQYWNIEQWTRE